LKAARRWRCYAASTYVNGAVLETAVKAVNGNVEDKPALMAALRSTNVDTVRRPVKFDDLGNVVGNGYLRKVTRTDGRLVNSVFKTYPDVSQFWTYGKGDKPSAKTLVPPETRKVSAFQSPLRGFVIERLDLNRRSRCLEGLNTVK
jgi:hypothetical protein